MRTCAYWWEEFQRRAMNPAAPQVQRDEMRLAFYAGFAGCLQISNDIATLSDDAAVQVLQGLHQESLAFMADLLARQLGAAK